MKKNILNQSIVTQHESWISIDPIIGCPAKCSYCYLATDNLFQKKPLIIESDPSKIYDLIEHSKYFNKNLLGVFKDIPICIGNYTDMILTPQNRNFLLSLLLEHKKRLPNVPVCIVTKGKLDREYLSQLQNLEIKIIFAISISFFPKDSKIEIGIPSEDVRIENFKKIKEFSNISGIHFWRPITTINASHEVIKTSLDKIIDSGSQASMLTGLKFGNQLANYLSEDNNPLSDYFLTNYKNDITTNEIVEKDLMLEILEEGKKRQYPIFLHTSCAVSFILSQSDYNGTFRKAHLHKCLASSCPTLQRQKCNEYQNINKKFTEKQISLIANILSIDINKIVFDDEKELISIDSDLKQSDLIYLTHSTGFTVKSNKVIHSIEWLGSISR